MPILFFIHDYFTYYISSDLFYFLSMIFYILYVLTNNGIPPTTGKDQPIGLFGNSGREFDGSMGRLLQYLIIFLNNCINFDVLFQVFMHCPAEEVIPEESTGTAGGWSSNCSQPCGGGVLTRLMCRLVKSVEQIYVHTNLLALNQLITNTVTPETTSKTTYCNTI